MSSGFIDFFQEPDAILLAPMHNALLQHGLGLRLHHDIDSLRGALEKPVAPSGRLVLLAGGHALNCLAAQSVRTTDVSVRMVALLPAFTDRIVAQAMHSGIDVCWPDSAPVKLLVAGVLRLVGQAPSVPGRPEIPGHGAGSGWRLVSRGWALLTPGGIRVPLTTAERALMQALCRAPANQLSHGRILLAVDQPGVDFPGRPESAAAGGRSDPSAPRRLSVLMSRLRRKFVAAGADMPIRSLRGVGYELCAEIHETEGASSSEAPRRRASLRIAAPQAPAAVSMPAQAVAVEPAGAGSRTCPS